MSEAPDIRSPPDFCQYVDGPCDQDFGDLASKSAFFAYPGDPSQIAAAVESAATKLNDRVAGAITWKQLPIHGQIIFCEICKTVRGSSTMVADVTTLNLNVMFEIGYGLGLSLPVIPIRDTTYLKDKRVFNELGLLDTLGYVDFQNSDDLASTLEYRLPGRALPKVLDKRYEEPLYVIKGRIETEGAVRLMACLKKSALRFRAYDAIETPRLSLNELRKQIRGSVSVVSHLLSPHRDGAQAHNALCAFASGMAMAMGKPVCMLQEEQHAQPIDYRDVVRAYTHPDQISGLLELLLRDTVAQMQGTDRQATRAEGVLERLDLGDVAAENEIGGLRSYFVKTGQFTQAKQGHARIVVGRKGTGKTAIFYGVRDFARQSRSTTILDLKPEGHQFKRLRETVLTSLTPGLQEHTMTAFWHYLLLTEFARKIVQTEENQAFRDPERRKDFEAVQSAYIPYERDTDEDFSERLLRQTEDLRRMLDGVPESEVAGRITKELYSEPIRVLADAIGKWLQEKGLCWLLVDNIDKGWPTRGTSTEDITIVRTLLEATRKLQRQLQRLDVELKCLVFLRSDIYEHLVRETADRGKDTAIVVEYDDLDAFREMVRLRIIEDIEEDGDFMRVWGLCFETHVGSEDAFAYMTERTLMRPRDLLAYLHRSVEVAINRGHERVTADDIEHAERSYSEDLLLATAFEIEDTHPEFGNVLYQFEGGTSVLGRDELASTISRAEVQSEDLDAVIDLLMWFGFIGVRDRAGVTKYAYEVRHNVDRLKVGASSGHYVVHPGFRAALSVTS